MPRSNDQRCSKFRRKSNAGSKGALLHVAAAYSPFSQPEFDSGSACALPSRDAMLNQATGYVPFGLVPGRADLQSKESVPLHFIVDPVSILACPSRHVALLGGVLLLLALVCQTRRAEVHSAINRGV